ncbi:ABC transporter ATP-binding protein [Nitrosovibrio sp. Nv4]|uniref:ABC transporter ATP-binding protein n=1 Tax=Nitrosovibrio sp. Nv4 TaxID=1945880 RepID=UPI000BCE534E|nr:ABC transporter ATP-binding protein [Nitrosovibrio sp. Nv4]SOD39850.1 lipopolysaccharide transport system ATP-binding protein [Nitrosovibrio sp. Nv4]
MFSETNNISEPAAISSRLQLETQEQQDGEERDGAERATMDFRHIATSTDIAINVRNVSKCYQIYDAPRDRLKQFIAPRLQRLLRRSPKQYFREFWALRDISLEIRKGETVGIIGRNGSGKSTLLQIICGTLAPSAGSVETKGRIAALLELGSGFNPEFTGRENVYMNGAVLGLNTEEIDERFDSIVSFADIGQFIDQPVKTYSSGMSVRLAFAVQAQIDPDILIVDEALSVGDAKFQTKCFTRLKQLKERGTSILIVTHASEQIVTHCSSAILLNSGVQLETGEPRRVVNRYMDLLFGKEKCDIATPRVQPGERAQAANRTKAAYQLNEAKDVFANRPGYNSHEYRWGDGTASILDFYLAADDEAYPSAITAGQRVTLAIAVKFHCNMLRPMLGITIKTKDGVTVSGTNSEIAGLRDLHVLLKAGSVIYVESDFRCGLGPGDYFISLGVVTRENDEIIPHDRRYDSIHFVVQPHNRFYGLADLEFNMAVTEISV